MNPIDVLQNQIDSDFKTLKEDVAFGVYRHNLKGLRNDARLIYEKIEKLKLLVGDKEIEREKYEVMSPKDESRFYNEAENL